MTVHDTIKEKITAALAPSQLFVVDESDKHKGHAGHRPGGETHFRVTVVSDAFDGKARVARQRMVTSALGAVIGDPVHALSMRTLTPKEAEGEDLP